MRRHSRNSGQNAGAARARASLAGERVSEEESRLRMLLDPLHEAVVVLDAAGRVVDYNISFARLKGGSCSTLTGSRIDLGTAGSPQLAGATGGSVSLDWAGGSLEGGGLRTYICRNGSAHHPGVNVEAIHQQISVIQEIYNNAAAGLALVNLDLCIHRLNQRFADFTGAPADKLLGQLLGEVVPALASSLADSCAAVIAAGEPALHITLQPVEEESKLRFASLYPVKDETGAVRGIAIVVAGEHDREPSEAQLAALNSELSQRVEAEQSLRSEAERSLVHHRTIEEQLILLVEASSSLLAAPDSSTVAQTILGLAKRFITADAYAVWRERQGVWYIEAQDGLSAGYARTAVGDATLDGPTAIPDIAVLKPFPNRMSAYESEGIRSMLAIPLRMHRRVSGTIVFYGRTPRDYTEIEKRVGAALGNLATSAWETADLYDTQNRLRREAQESERKAKFLAQAGAVLASSLDYEETLSSVAALAVSTFCDWAAVDIVDEDGVLRRVATLHIDPAKVEFANEFLKKYPPREDDLPHIVVRTGQPILMADIPEEFLQASARDEEHLTLVRELGLTSAITVPLQVRERTLGSLTFVTAGPDRRFSQADLELAEELAGRAATAVDNALLHREVRRSEERHRSLLSASTASVWIISNEGEFVRPQPSWEAYTGQTWEQHRGLGWESALHPEDREYVLRHWLRDRTRSAVYETSVRLWNAAAKEYRYATARIAPVRDPDGSIREWVGTVTDVHEKHQAEEERRELLTREQEARRTAELLHRLGQSLSAELDPQKLTQRVTDIATQLSGAEFGALFHNVVSEQGESYTLYTLSGAPPEAFSKFPLPRKTAVFGPTFDGEGPVRSDDITQDPRYGRNAPYKGMPSGHLKVRSYLAVPVVSLTGEVLGGLFFGHSEPGIFTERAEELVVGLAAQASIALDNARLFADSQRTQDALRRSNQELRRVNDDLNQFAYSASHDLQEPLRMVSIYSQMLKKKYQHQLDAAANRYLDFAVEGAQRMEALVKDLLAYTQAATLDGQEIPPCDAGEVLQAALLNLQAAIQECGAVISFDPLPTLRVNEIHLLQLFQNLIGNALKYRGRKPPRIDISAVPHEGNWQFSIQDNGIGIDPAYKEQIFGIFKRLHTAADYTGTGIGLAICQKIVQRYGTRIWVESEPGRGATFFFTLPAGN